jgi:hypothetical protein
LWNCATTQRSKEGDGSVAAITFFFFLQRKKQKEEGLGETFLFGRKKCFWETFANFLKYILF